MHCSLGLGRNRDVVDGLVKQERDLERIVRSGGIALLLCSCVPEEGGNCADARASTAAAIWEGVLYGQC
jgi:hypothetical protein